MCECVNVVCECVDMVCECVGVHVGTHFALLSTFARHSAVSRFTTTETGILVRAVFPSSPREVTSPSLSWAEEEEEEEEEGGGLKNKSA